MLRAPPLLAALGLCASLSAAGLSAAIGRAVGSRVAHSPVPESLPPPPRPPPLDDYLAVLLGRDLFDATAPAGSTASAPAGGRLVLVGTLRADPEIYSSAAIADRDSPHLPRIYGVDDLVDDRVVASIDPGRVTLRRPDGVLDVLVLRGDDAYDVAPADTPDAIPPRTISRSLLHRYLEDPAELAALVQARARSGPNGDITGFELMSLPADGLGADLGLRPGDVLRTLNGRPLADEILEATVALATEPRLCVGIVRRGRPRELCFDVE